MAQPQDNFDIWYHALNRKTHSYNSNCECLDCSKKRLEESKEFTQQKIREKRFYS